MCLSASCCLRLKALVCVSVCLSNYLLVYLRVCLSFLFLSVWLCSSLFSRWHDKCSHSSSIYLTVYLSIYLSLNQSLHLSNCLFFMSIYLCLSFLSICHLSLSMICLSVYFSSLGRATVEFSRGSESILIKGRSEEGGGRGVSRRGRE